MMADNDQRRTLLEYFVDFAASYAFSRIPDSVVSWTRGLKSRGSVESCNFRHRAAIKFLRVAQSFNIASFSPE